MIVKELDPFDSNDKYRKAGRKAEEQMAFYLKRAFEKQPDLHVLNNIRLEHNNDAAQIDHLVIHPYGIVIIESKSVKDGKIQIKDDGQWVRWYNNESKGMASPLNQAKLQKTFLQEVLIAASKNPNAASLINAIPIHITIAISDNGLIIWPKSGEVPGVHKSDQITEIINKIITEETSKQGNRPAIGIPNIQKMSEYLIKAHRPLIPLEKQNAVEQKTEQKQAKYTTPETPKKQCKHCNSSKLEITFAKDYYFRCLDCNKNTAIKKPFCESCNRTMRLHKNKNDFHMECDHCKSSKLFHSNK